MNENAIYLNFLQNDLKAVAFSRNKGKMKKIFRKVFSSPEYPLYDGQVYSLVGNTFCENQQFFLDKFYKDFHKEIDRSPFSDKKYEMESSIIENFSLYNQEKIITAFSGKVIEGDTILEGRLYLTNIRIIAHGKFRPTTSSTLMMASIFGGTSGAGSGGGIYYNYKRVEKMHKAIQSAMGSVFQDKPCFGFQFPVLFAYDIRRDSKAVKYKVKVEFAKGKKIKRKTLKLKIESWKEKKESSDHFKRRREENLSTVHQILNEMSQGLPTERMSIETTHSFVTCYQCGNTVSNNAEFCNKCGSQYICPSCSFIGSLRFIEEYQRWWCDSCQQYL